MRRGECIFNVKGVGGGSINANKKCLNHFLIFSKNLSVVIKFNFNWFRINSPLYS